MIARLTAILFITVLLFSGCGDKETSTPKEEKPIQKVEKKKKQEHIINLTTTDMQDMKLTALENGIKFEDYPEKVVLLVFFATWCPPCIDEIPHLNAVQNAYKSQVQIIGILLEENKTNSQIGSFIQTHDIIYPVTNSRQNYILAEALGGIRSLPTTVMYDKKGDYHTHFVGKVPQEMIETEIKKALAK